jgi:hypothetical protein
MVKTVADCYGKAMPVAHTQSVHLEISLFEDSTIVPSHAMPRHMLHAAKKLDSKDGLENPSLRVLCSRRESNSLR